MTTPSDTSAIASIRRLRFRWQRLAALGFLLAATIGGINLWMVHQAQPQLHRTAATLPRRETGLVLGTERLRPDGSTNWHFRLRAEAAAALFHSGKVERLLVSGHPDNRGCNEPREMAEALVVLGVPRSQIDVDELGQRTWESVRSAVGPWQLEECTVITDAFHAPRALFLCKRAGLTADAFVTAEAPFNLWTCRSVVREWFARVRALADHD